MDISNENRFLLACLKIKLNEKDAENWSRLLNAVTKWNKLLNTAVRTGVAPILYRKLEKLPDTSNVPSGILSELRKIYYATLVRSMVLYEAFNKIAQALSAANIKVVALKGIYLGEHLYKDIGLRKLSDIDLLVPKEDGEKCLGILASMGYVSAGNEVSALVTEYIGMTHYPAMINNNVSVEIHIALHHANETYKLDPHKVISNAVPVTINHVEVFAPDLYDLFVYQCVHLHKHNNPSDLQLTGFVDILNLLELHSRNINWEVLAERAHAYRCTNVVFKYLLLANSYFNALLPEDIVQKYATCVTAHDQLLFMRYFEVTTSKSYKASTHIEVLRNLKGFAPSVRYLISVMFPSKEYMLHTYRPAKPKMLGWYYIYRVWTGLLGAVKYFLAKLASKFRSEAT